MNKSFAIKSYLCYLLKARHREGFGIHSPFVFSLLNSVFYEEMHYYCYEKIEDRREELKNSSKKISVNDQGTGGYAEREISNIVRKSVKRTKYAQLLFRLANSNCSEIILELGTCVGLTTLYLSQVNRQGRVITIDADKAITQIAEENFRNFSVDNVELLCGKVDDLLPGVISKLPKVDFVFFDANHSYEATLKYFELCLPKAHKDTIFVFDDIYRDKGMFDAWKEIKQNREVKLAIDIFEMGIVFFNTDLIKQEYRVAF